MSGFIEFCVELKSASEGAAAAEVDGEVSLSQQPGGQEERSKNGRGGRRGMLHRQGSVVCSRVQSLNTISYVDDGEGQTCLTAPLSFLEVAPSVPFHSVRDFFSAFVHFCVFCFCFFRKRNQTLEAQESCVFLRPTGVCSVVLCSANRESGAGLKSPIRSDPILSETKSEHFTLRFKTKQKKRRDLL